MVRYVDVDAVVSAAIVTAVREHDVDLMVITRSSIHPIHRKRKGQGPDSWHHIHEGGTTA